MINAQSQAQNLTSGQINIVCEGKRLRVIWRYFNSYREHSIAALQYGTLELA